MSNTFAMKGPPHYYTSSLTKTWQVLPQILNLEATEQISTILTSIPYVSWPKRFFSSYWSLSVLLRPWRPDSRSLLPTVDVEMCLLLELWAALMWAQIWGTVNWRFLRLVTLMNLFPAAEVTLGLPFPGWVLMRASCVIMHLNKKRLKLLKCY